MSTANVLEKKMCPPSKLYIQAVAMFIGAWRENYITDGN